ncbi:hypothetical protein [Saccharomonospora glauca]|jgi:hypothetical protein|uniref:Uncharacterized protein n=1 Tax=Saccharomonospora glauca K62 TaxID=928724 RepID=I1CYW8_9PSEU|nr:hypothetical protein [Saccharomonospora glauca]EIE97892.1 hypothetical protein SacglDRAFT_00955 [Saccharomonospora glauca K62]
MPEIDPHDHRTQRVQQRLAVPVLSAAVVSVPAVFLATTPGTPGVIGTVLNWLSLAVLMGESVALLWASGSLHAYLRRYRAHLVVVGLTVPAVVFLVGPAQVLRLLLALGAFRILRVRRILRAGKVIVHRTGLDGRRGRWVLTAVTLLAVGFAAVVLANPESRTRRALDRVVDLLGVGGTALAALGVTTIGLVVLVLLRRDTRG